MGCILQGLVLCLANVLEVLKLRLHVSARINHDHGVNTYTAMETGDFTVTLGLDLMTY